VLQLFVVVGTSSAKAETRGTATDHAAVMQAVKTMFVAEK